MRKLSARDAERIEEHTGLPPEELEDADLEQVMDELGIQAQPLTQEEQAEAIAAGGPDDDVGEAAEPAAAPSSATDEPASTAAPQAGESGEAGSYTAELERLADLHAKGILTDEEFDAKKKQILGI